MATIDLGYDLAFLLMDLDIHVGRHAANRVLNRYLARRPDMGMLALMPVFLSLRALIRAHVHGNSGRDWRPYLDYAETVLHPPRAVGVGIGGLPGSGKSTIARQIAPSLGAAPGAVILRSDEIRKRQHGVAPETRLPQEAYTKARSKAVMDALFADMRQVMAAGHAVIADLTFINPEHRTQARNSCAGSPFVGLWLTAPPDVLRARVAARQGDASDATVDVLESMLAANPGAGAWHEIDGADPKAATRIAAIIRNVSEPC